MKSNERCSAHLTVELAELHCREIGVPYLTADLFRVAQPN